MPPSKGVDPFLAQRRRTDAILTVGERKAHAALIVAMTRWLDAARALVLHQPLDVLTAAAGDQPPDIDAARASFEVWSRALIENVEPVLEEAFSEGFRQQSRVADISPVHYQEEHMRSVHDRLKIWPEGAFEELRPELLEAMAEGEDYDQVTDRIGRILNIDAPSRRIRAEISEIDRKLADEATPSAEIAGLKGRRRQLWEQHDESLLEWQWKARRIARTEVHGAMQAGTWAAAQASAQATGKKMYKAWLATSDERTRVEHVVAEGQMVPLETSFSVAGYPMMFPGDPFAPGHLVIQCRCSMRILTEDEVQTELQGQWGGRGVGPGNARLGPDLNDDVTLAIEKWKAEQRGEVVGDNRPPWQQERDARREAPTERNPGWTDDAFGPPQQSETQSETVVPDDDEDDPFAEHDRLFDDDGDLGDDDLDRDAPDEEPSGNSGEFDDEDDEHFGPLEPTTVDGTDEVTDGLARRDVQDYPEPLRERLQENGVTVEIADTILDAPAGAFLADDEVDDGRPWDTVGGVYLNYGDQGGAVILSGVEHGSENMAFHELSHAVDDKYLHNQPLTVEWQEQGARHLPASIRPAVQQPYRRRITRVTDDPYLEWAHKIVFAENKADHYYVTGSTGDERSGRDEWFAESLAAFLVGATAKMLEVSGGNRRVVDVLTWTFRRILKL
ncbi:phage minor head protein [Rhodococcoides kyotonense]|uniref:Phage Mu protein F like protein n=1 Tax=Rhodococcoides kyotonense TaxID=398843 RepID=A0A239FRF0_9NOCA|nr:phage minor head protein [Rhodococcus kyotonensis]SNS58812.1 Phage Mu protein F like protein [Rhodococcus kyotonensis]